MTMPAPATALMNGIYRRQRHLYDFTRKYYLVGRDRLIAGLAPETGHRVLEIGCGTGRNLIVAARKYPRTNFVGIDVSTEMLTTAIEAVARAKLSTRIRVFHADATRLDSHLFLGDALFDRVFMSYSLSMIPHWRTALDRAIARLAPDGELHIVDFGGQQGLPPWFRTGLRKWLAQFHVAPRDELERDLAVRAEQERMRLRVERPYRDYAQYAVLKRTAESHGKMVASARTR